MITDLGDWVIPHLEELYQRALQNVYWRSRRAGLAPNEAKSLREITAKVSDESGESLESQRNKGVKKQGLKASRPRLVKARDIAGTGPEVPSSGTQVGSDDIILGGVDEPEETPTSGAYPDPRSREAAGWGPGIDVGSEDDEIGNTTSTYSIRPTHLSDAELNQLLSRPDMKVTDTKGAGAARSPRHHLFPQPYREWFWDHHLIDIDRYTIEMNWGWHSAIHTMGWNRKVKEFIDRERLLGITHSRMDIFRFINKLRRDFNLKGRKIVPYED
jgi:hypothetical protein